jgi:hypothetical protein
MLSRADCTIEQGKTRETPLRESQNYAPVEQTGEVRRLFH